MTWLTWSTPRSFLHFPAGNCRVSRISTLTIYHNSHFVLQSEGLLNHTRRRLTFEQILQSRCWWCVHMFHTDHRQNLVVLSIDAWMPTGEPDFLFVPAKKSPHLMVEIWPRLVFTYSSNSKIETFSEAFLDLIAIKTRVVQRRPSSETN